jgi:hypothetical protein
MKKIPLFLALALAGLLSPASAQFTFSGTDTFGAGSLGVGAGQRWVTSYGNATGAFSEGGGLLSYASTSEGPGYLRWSGINTYADNHFDHDWTAAVTVTNTANAGAGFVSAGLQIYTTFEGNGTIGNVGSLYSNAYYAFYLVGGGVETEFAKYDEALDDFTSPIRFHTGIGDSTDVTLRLSWAAADNLLTASYSTNGTTFFTAGTFDLAGAQAGYADPYNQRFGLELFANSGAGAGGITSGVSFDNMSVSAVPEPSTYAAFAGLAALGLASWRRRQTRLAAVRA